MKKSVLALAVLGTFAGVASAQGSVTLFGIVDLNVRTVSNDERTYSMGQDGLSSSRLGFRGVEDLGGGLKASFWLEGALGPDTGTGTSSFGNGNNQGLTFQRRSTVSLQNQWGELRLGRDYTATFWNWTDFDPFGTNGLGAASNLGLGYPVTSAVGAGGAYGTTVRANNMVAYILPNGTHGPGLYGEVQVAAGESAPGNKYYGGRIGYAAGPFNVAGAWGRTQVAQNVDLDNYNVAGSWNFGIAKLSGFYGHLELDGLGGSNADQDNWYVGITAPRAPHRHQVPSVGRLPSRLGRDPVPAASAGFHALADALRWLQDAQRFGSRHRPHLSQRRQAEVHAANPFRRLQQRD
jgi:predicted porin